MVRTIRGSFWSCRTSVCCAVLAMGARAGAQPHVASALLREGGPLPGVPGVNVSSINNSAVNHAGGYAFQINGNDNLSRVWGNAAGGAGAVLRTEGTFGPLVQTGFESFYGISDVGRVSYSPTGTGGPVGGFDSVWVDDDPIALEGNPVVSLPGQFWVFASRPGITADGRPYWVGGFSSTQGGATQNRALFFGTDSQVLLSGGQMVPGLPIALSTTNPADFDYRVSAHALNYICPVGMAASSTTDEVIVISGAGLMLGGSLVREDSILPAAIGGLPGERWGSFGFTGISDAGDYFFTNVTRGGATATDQIIVVNGVVAYREGSSVDDLTLVGAIEGAYMNNDGDVAYVWDFDDDGIATEALFLNDRFMLREGQAVDLDGDGQVENGSVLSDFTGISALTLSDRDNLMVSMYFTADVDVNGTPSTTDDIEGAFRLTVFVGLLGDLNCDGIVSVNDIGPFVLALTDPTAYESLFPDCGVSAGDINGDDQVSVGDIGPFVALLTGG